MGELKEAWVCKSHHHHHHHCTHPCVKQSILINISCNENLLIRKNLKLSCFPRGSQIPCFCLFWYFLMMSFSGRPSWKNADKTSCNNGPKRTSFSFLSGAELVIVWAKQGQKCWKSKSTKIHKQFGMATHTYPHSQTFFYVCFPWHHPPPLLPKPTQLIDRVWE